MQTHLPLDIERNAPGGNAFFIMGRATAALKQAEMSDQIVAFKAEATSGDYENLVATCKKWFEVTDDDE